MEGKHAEACELFDILDQFRKPLIIKTDNTFCGLNVKMYFRKKYIFQPAVDQLMRESLTLCRQVIDYLPKWYKFHKSAYRYCPALSIHGTTMQPLFDDILDVWMHTPFKENVPSYNFNKQVKLLTEVYEFFSATGNISDT
ncbi:hypothetical protein RF11_05568 [Thelohanellus kitauei]|uniref:Uncharacterized protein n=1 Tax=Thelohanellus kitauei TaxID=669202 RepID=A0A0C2NDP9_THEKT|nr:hypothetical protein RF11_05568 [Thelohanellus kitauei]